MPENQPTGKFRCPGFAQLVATLVAMDPDQRREEHEARTPRTLVIVAAEGASPAGNEVPIDCVMGREAGRSTVSK